MGEVTSPDWLGPSLALLFLLYALLLYSPFVAWIERRFYLVLTREFDGLAVGR